MSHGIKLFPTVPNYRFVASNEGWTAESGASIYANANSITAQNELHIVSSGQTVGAISPLVTLVGSETPVRAEIHYKTINNTQTFNLTMLNQAGTVIGSTVFATSAYSTTFNDWRRAVVDLDVPTGTTGVRIRACRGNATAGEITITQASLNENVILLDPDSIQRTLVPTRAQQRTLSGRRVVDTIHRHYQMNYSWNVMDSPTYDRLQQYLYRNQELWLNDGEVPDNQELHAIYSKGQINTSNIQSIYTANDPAGVRLYAETVVDSRLPTVSGFGTAATSWSAAAMSNAASTNGASIQTSNNSVYAYARWTLPTWGASYGNWNYAATLQIDVVSEVKSPGVSGPYGFDVWLYDFTSSLWRRVSNVPRTGETKYVLDLRSLDMLSAFTEANALYMNVLFRARSTNQGAGAKLTFKNFHWYGNTGFDTHNTESQTMGAFAGYDVTLLDAPRSITYVELDSREVDNVSSRRLPTTLTADADYKMTPTGVAFPQPSPNATARQQNGAQVLIRYTRDFRVILEQIPEQFYRTGAVTAHDRWASITLSTVRSSRWDELNDV